MPERMLAQIDNRAADVDIRISDRAVQRELLGLVLGIEKKAQIANAVCWLIMVVAVVRLGELAAFAIPLASRFVASPLTHLSFRRARRILVEGGTGKAAMRPVTIALIVGGASWASMLPPLLDLPLNQPAAMLIFGALVSGITIIVSMLAPVPVLALVFAASFQITAAILLLAVPHEGYTWQTLLAIDGLFLVFLAYAFAATNRQEETARTLVTNRALTARLSQSLHDVAELAFRDPLTGLMNRRSFFTFAQQLDPVPGRHVLTIDLDHFKAINDEFGHAMGDRVLERVGAALRDAIAGLDGEDHCAARMGGEEFAMIVSLAEPRQAVAVAEHVRSAIAAIAPEIGLADLTTSASIGIGEWREGLSLDEALAQSDGATYRAKAAGRNRVIRAAA